MDKRLSAGYVCENNAASSGSKYKDHELALWYTHEEIDAMEKAADDMWNSSTEVEGYETISADTWSALGPYREYPSHRQEEFRAAEIVNLIEPIVTKVPHATKCTCVGYEDARPELNNFLAVRKMDPPAVKTECEGPAHAPRWVGSTTFLGSEYVTNVCPTKTAVTREIAHLIMHHSKRVSVNPASDMIVNTVFTSLLHARCDSVMWVNVPGGTQLRVVRSTYEWTTSYFADSGEMCVLMCKHAYNIHFFGYRLLVSPEIVIEALLPYVGIRDWSTQGCVLQNDSLLQVVTNKDTLEDVLLRIMRVYTGKVCVSKRAIVSYGHFFRA